MNAARLTLLFVLGLLALSHCGNAVAPTRITMIIIVHSSPESQAVDTDGDGKVTLQECLATTLQLFPDESAQDQAAIAEGCMMLLNAQQKSPTDVADIDSDVTSTTATNASAQEQQRVFAQAFKDRLAQYAGVIKQGALKYREEYIHSRWLLNKAKEHKKSILAAIAFILIPLYAMGLVPRLQMFVGSIFTTARNLFDFSGKERRISYLLWSVAVAILIILVEAFSLFTLALPKLSAARGKLGFRETNWAQFFNGTSRVSHALVWLLMTSASIRRVRSAGYPSWVLAPFFLMALSVDVNDVLQFIGVYTVPHGTAVLYLLQAISYLATIGYSVAFTAGVVIILFVLPEADEVAPDEKSQANFVQAHMNSSGQYFTVATVPSTVVAAISVLAQGCERAENVIPAILSFFFHGVGYLFQGRIYKFVFTLAVSAAIWYDFYALHIVGTSVGEFTQGWLDLSNQADSASTHVLSVLKSFADQDHPKICSFYWHAVIFFAVHLSSTLDVLSFTKKSRSKA